MKAWRFVDDSVRIWHYTNYPASYSDELINLCWYCWGGGLYPSRQFTGVEFVWNIDNLRPAVGYTVRQNMIRSVTTQIGDFQKNQSVQFSLFISTEEKPILLISPVCKKVDKWVHNWMKNDWYNLQGHCVVKGFSQICVERTQLGGSESYHT